MFLTEGSWRYSTLKLSFVRIRLSISLTGIAYSHNLVADFNILHCGCLQLNNISVETGLIIMIGKSDVIYPWRDDVVDIRNDSLGEGECHCGCLKCSFWQARTEVRISVINIFATCTCNTVGLCVPASPEFILHLIDSERWPITAEWWCQWWDVQQGIQRDALKTDKSSFAIAETMSFFKPVCIRLFNCTAWLG